MKATAGNPHVLIIVENLPVPLDRRVWQESCALRDAGYRVTVICPQMRGYNAEEETLDGIDIFRHWISEEASGIWGFLREYSSALIGELRLAWRVWRRAKFDVIHICNPPDLLFLVTLPFKFLGKVKVIYDIHDLWPEMFEAKFERRGVFYWGVRLMERLTLHFADLCLATNESVAEKAALRGGRKQMVVVRTSPQAIDTSAPTRDELRKARTYLLGYIGVMGSSDGVHYLIEAAKILIQERNRADLQFLLMGTGPEYESLKQKCVEERLEDFVEMPGRVSDAFLCSALQTMDLGLGADPINAYNDHCTMNKTLEYMAFGKPQVMFGIKEGKVSAGEAAVYVEENSARAFADAIEKLLAQPEKMKEMGKVGRARLSNELSWQASRSNLLRAYGLVLGELKH